ncbi:hypothetical protein [Caudoviricetes sp.]|nr:hypothetical protein [Caudoviricetes sp.]
MDGIRATPMQNPILGLLADKLKKAQQFAVAPGGYANPPAEILLNLLGVPAVQQTMERMAYGEPLTTGRGMTTQIRPEVAEAALTLLPVAGKTAQVAERGAMAAGRAGERMAERVVPQIMERGGMPASLLSDLATNTTSKMFVPATAEEAYKASRMLKKKSPQQVWQEMGVVRGPDGEFRKEISDKASRYDPEALEDLKFRDDFDYLKHTQPFDTVLEHKKLFEYDPELGNIPVHFMPAERMKGAYGAYSPTHNRLTLSDQLSPEKARSSALHEIQHAIQEKSGFAVGGNMRDFAKMRQDAFDQIGELNTKMGEVVKQMDNPSISKQEKDALRSQYEDLMAQRQSLVSTAQLDPMEAYANLMGEAEARLTQRRMDLSDAERRKYFPFEYTGETGYGLDVPLDGLINMTPEGTIIRRGLLGR